MEHPGEERSMWCCSSYLRACESFQWHCGWQRETCDSVCVIFHWDNNGFCHKCFFNFRWRNRLANRIVIILLLHCVGENGGKNSFRAPHNSPQSTTYATGRLPFILQTDKCMQTTGFAINFMLWFCGLLSLDAQGKYMEAMLILERVCVAEAK